jgi:hypothetical protein
VLFGSAALFLGAGCGALALFSLTLPFLVRRLPTSAAPAADLRSALLGFLTYALAGAVLAWAGVGSIRKRRWVRPVMLTIAWTWLFVGLFGLLAAVAVLDDLPYLARPATPWSPEMVLAVQCVVLGITGVAGVLLPALFVWAYGDERVLLTCRREDPEPGWADRCPWPVLLLSLELALAAVLTLLMVLRPVVPLFGLLVTGWPAVPLLLAGGAIMGCLALATYRCSTAGWWGTTLLLVLLGLSTTLTSLVTDPALLYRELGYSQSAAALSPSAIRFVRVVGVWGSLGFTLLGLVYMTAIRKHFATPR